MSKRRRHRSAPALAGDRPDTSESFLPAAPDAASTGIAAADDDPRMRGFVYFPNLTGKHQFKSYTRREARRRSQWAAWNIPPARKATRDLARWVGAVSLSPSTSDEEFNAEHSEWWHDTYERRAGHYDASGKYTASGFVINALNCTFRDGDMGAAHIIGPHGEPLVMAVESALIESPTGYDAAWCDGVLVGPHYEHLAYNVRGDDRGREANTRIDAAHFHLFANYETHSATRGTPALIHAIPQIMDYREIDNDVRKILKVHGLVGFYFKKELGASTDVIDPFQGKSRRDNLAGRGTQTTAAAGAPSNIPARVNEVFDNGQILNLPPGVTPGVINDGREFPVQAAVKQDIYHQIAMGLGVPVELLFMLDKLTGPGVRFVLRQAQEWRNYWLDQQVKFLTVDYVRRTEWAIRTRQIRRPKDPAWWRHTINYPRAITIDEGRDAAAQIKRLDAGLTNWATEYGEQGDQWKPPVRQRIQELKFAAEECEREGVPAERFFVSQKPAATPSSETIEALQSHIAQQLAEIREMLADRVLRSIG